MNIDGPDTRFGWFLGGVALISAALIMLSMVMTRIYSVVLYYHFSFLSISLAMFGLTLSGVLVYLFPRFFSEKNLPLHLVVSCIIFSVFSILSLILVLNYYNIPKKRAFAIFPLTVLTLGTSFPFIFAGTTLSLALTHFRKRVSRVYFSDLVGSGTGCLLTILALRFFGGPGAVLFLAAVGAASGMCFSIWSNRASLKRIATLVTIMFMVLLVANYGFNFLTVTHVKIGIEQEHLYEGWNTFSRILVTPIKGNTGVEEKSRFLWSNGLSTTFKGYKPEQVMANIDAFAASPITRFNGNLNEIEYTKYDVNAFAYFFLKNPRVLIIGPGGGKEILSALAFRANRIEAVELNPLFEEVVNQTFGDFTGQLYRYPGVTTYIDEGRSFVRRSRDKYDLIQASLIDTWAANAAGAYLLTENVLYTVEAFQDYWDHLADNGIITISRYLFTPPTQTLRLVSLALEVMDKEGIKEPGKHIMVLKALSKKNPQPSAVKSANPKKSKKGLVKLDHVASNVLISKSPFTQADYDLLESKCRELNFETVYSYQNRKNEDFTGLIHANDREKFYNEYYYDVSPSTDDRPFFFNVLRLKEYRKAIIGYSQDFNLIAVRILVYLLIIIMAMIAATVLVPMLFKGSTIFGGKDAPLSMLIYFAGLGLGYLLIEMAMLQRFILFLGHPIYSLAVILFCLLFFSGIGSILTDRLKEPARKWRWIILLAVIGIQLLYLIILPKIFMHFLPYSVEIRVLLSILLLIPMGLLMGMPFPLGIKELTYRQSTAVPWMWAINGSFSVMASVAAIMIAMNWGFTWVAVSGSCAYGLSFLVSLFWAGK